ncbi:uncharacterized protein BJ212DRAFT_1232086, partial [Suillus subaureus]
VGKSILALRFSHDSLSPGFISTIGLEFKGRHMKVEARSRAIAKASYRRIYGIVMVYDVTNQTVFH